MTYSTRGKRLESARVLEALETNPGTVGGCSAIRVGRISRSNAARQFDTQTSDFRVMDTPTAVATRSGSRPRTDRKIFRFNRQSPAGVELYDICPTDGDFFERVSDDKTLVANGNLRTDQENINTYQHKEGNEYGRYFADGTTLVETRPYKESAEYNSKPGKDEISPRTVNLSVIHTSILSYLAPDSIKAVS